MNQELTPQLLNCLFSLWTSFDKLRYSHFFQGEGKILDYLYLSESGCASPTQIGHSLHFSSPRVAAALNNLQKKTVYHPPKVPSRRSVHHHCTHLLRPRLDLRKTRKNIGADRFPN